MFSTYCPTCQTMVLLGTRRIVHPGTGGPEAVLLRCTCGTLVSGADRAPEPEVAEPSATPPLAEAS